MVDWIAAHQSAGELRVWIREGAAWREPLIAAQQDDVMQSLLGVLEPHLEEGHAVPVLLCGETQATPVAVPCVPPPPKLLTGNDPRLVVHALPGLAQQTPPDLMQGEETHIAGVLAAQPDFDGVICVTGARSVWAHVSAGEIVSFRSFLSIEIFDLLGSAPHLGPALAGTAWDAEAFATAVDETMSRPERGAGLLASLSAQHRLGGLSSGAARARAAGALVGQELAAAKAYWLGRDVALVGAGDWPARYAAALCLQGVRAPCHDGVQMMLRGMAQAYEGLAKR